MLATMQDAVREWAFNVGHKETTKQWLLSDYDTWTPNPHYIGPDQGHPETQEGPRCTVWLTFKDACKEAASSAVYFDRPIPVERYLTRWVVRYEA